MKFIEGGITAPRGFLASGVRCGIKQSGLDLAIICSEAPAVCAALFTTNLFKAAPVLVSMEHAASGKAIAVVANSGCANACTGERGITDARRMASMAANELGTDAESVLVCSTGVIGRFLPMDKVERGVVDAAKSLSSDGALDAAKAIMTTDTCPKMAACEIDIGGVPVRIGGIAKGAGMIRPDLATMFCFLTTDAVISLDVLKRCLQDAVEVSFNSLTVDGDTSTNDTVIALANGFAGNQDISSDSEYVQTFSLGLKSVCIELAKAMARDGEGATKLVEVVVRGAVSYEDAKTVAMTVANSLLVKTAVFGEDPNWGRVLAAAGRSGIEINPSSVDLYFGDVKIVEDGEPLDVPDYTARAPMLDDELVITIDLKLGSASSRVFTCDLSYDYVKINAEYHT
jgi:glutamate N-acetyltransferase/amino-acid N-acetyltransferase